MGILKGFTNLFIGEDDSDGIDFSQDFGSPNGGKGSAAKDSFFDDFNGNSSKTGSRSKDKEVISTPDPFDDSFVRSFAASESEFNSSKGNSFEEDRKMSFEQTTTLQIVLARPVDFSEVRSIGDDINAFKTVILNLEMVKSDDAKRILDFLSGVDPQGSPPAPLLMEITRSFRELWPVALLMQGLPVQDLMKVPRAQRRKVQVPPRQPLPLRALA